MLEIDLILAKVRFSFPRNQSTILTPLYCTVNWLIKLSVVN